MESLEFIIEDAKAVAARTLAGIRLPAGVLSLVSADVEITRQRLLLPYAQIQRSMEPALLLNERMNQTAADAWETQQHVLHSVGPVLGMASVCMGQVGVMWQAQRERVERTVSAVWSVVDRVGAMWQTVREGIEGVVERWKTWLYLPFYMALRDLEEGDIAAVNSFLIHHCGMGKPTMEAHGILWEVLSAGGWRQTWNPGGYVKAAVWRQYNKPAGKLLVADKRITTLDAVAGKLWVPGDDYRKVEERMFVEQLLDSMTPQDRRALLLHCWGETKSLKEAYGSKNAQDAGRRRLRKIAEAFRPHLLS